MSRYVRPAHMTLTPHHLFYLLSCLEDLDIPVGPMNVRLENIHYESSPANYVSFLQQPKAERRKTDKDSLHSISSTRSVMSSMSTFWSTLGFGHSHSSKSEKAKAAIEADLKYLYSAFTKLPALRLSPDHRARLIKGYEEFPFDTAVPLFAFKNVQQLDIVDIDFRQFFGWDRLSEQLILLTVKRANLDDPVDLITNIVLDDAEKRRKRSTRNGSRTPLSEWTMPTTPPSGLQRSNSDPTSTLAVSPEAGESKGPMDATDRPGQPPPGSLSPPRSGVRPGSSYRHVRSYSSKAKRSGSGSSDSSDCSGAANRSDMASGFLSSNTLLPNKWIRLKFLSLADNSLTSISALSIQPLANTLRSLNLSCNLFTEIPDSLASLTRLTSLDLSDCMIDSLHSLTRSPLPAITTIKLRSNRLTSLAGVERLLSLENLNVQDNLISDPMEAARLTGIPNLRRIWAKHNPFTKTHSHYRATIFNLFRSAPGYTEDIILDDYSPSYSERKQLIERVQEIERPTVIGASDQRKEPAPVIVHQANQRVNETASSGPTTSKDRDNGPLRLQASSIRPDYTPVPSRRKKVLRRRIVELSNQDSASNAMKADALANSTKLTVRTSAGDQISSELANALAEAADRCGRDGGGLDLPAQKPESPSLAPQPQLVSNDLTNRTDDYRLRIEALKQEFGSNWISALSQRGWEGGFDLTHPDLRHCQYPMTPMHRANNQVIVSSGRTLG